MPSNYERGESGLKPIGMDDKCALLVESNYHLREVIAASLENKNWRVLEASSGEFAEELLMREKPDVLIVEYLPRSEADSAIIDAYRSEDGHDGHVVLTVLDRPVKNWIHKHKPDAIIYKPFDVRYLERRMDEIIQEKGGDGG